jgi:ABC-2 type transport system permease protein
VLVTPMRTGVLLVGKLLPFLVIGCVDVAFGMTVGAWVFDVPIRGSLGLIGAATLCYVMTTLGIGLLISTFSKTQQQAFLGAFLFAMPAMLLSGVMTPIRAMPPWLQSLTLANPLRYFVALMREVMLKGSSLADVWGNLLVLALFGLAIITTATLRFHKRVA